ncbi:MAG: F0F1 ATP synthase subunit gamma [Lactobacillaceae bacterium]|jgi:F-type H+-transporting ATPase subunit gamma|nr:F0F1 ATP synthase subunit gamma [Lactobacillaceae bacterium]
MANLQDIKRRIDSIKKTSQITSAMQMVSTSKLSQIQRHTSGYIQYANRVEAIVGHLVETNDLFYGKNNEVPFLAKREVKKIGILVITSDRGLVGGYNNQIIKQTDQLINNLKLSTKNTVIFALGGKGADYYAKKGYQIAFEDRDITDVPKFTEVMDIVKSITEQFAAEKFDEMYMTYNHYKNRLTNEFKSQKILPISPENFQRDENGELVHQNNFHLDYDFDTDTTKLLQSLLPQFAQSLIYGAILDAKTAEHSASSTAMKAASDNAKNLISTLNLKYNRARQAAITTEITEITGGMAALN